MKYYSALVFLSFFFLLTLSVPPYLFIYSDGNLIEGVIMVLAQTKKKKKKRAIIFPSSFNLYVYPANQT